MRTLKYALLGLIDRQPITGYDITKEFESNAMANFWYAKHSQVYPELKRLTDEGMIRYEVVIQGEKLEKKLYTITEKGRKELKKWLLKDEPLGITPKDVFRLRTYFSDVLSNEDMARHFKDQLDKHHNKRQYLAEMLEDNYKNSPVPGTPEAGDYMVLLGAVMREDSYLKWLEYCLQYIRAE